MLEFKILIFAIFSLVLLVAYPLTKRYFKLPQFVLGMAFGSSIPISRPSYWVGIKIVPSEYEFWEGGEFRLHKRVYYYLRKNEWHRKILSP